MAFTIAISGKGGSGKTTLSSIIIKLLSDRAAGTILAVDADPNSCLGLTMGVDVIGTIAELREQTRSKTPDNSGMDKIRSLEYGLQQVISEAKGFDLLTMGHPEGPSCYCAANNLLRQFMDKLNSQYKFVLIDNEAGMEHLSRRTTNNIDLLCIVAEQNVIGEATAQRIYKLVQSLPITVKQTGIIWNKTDTAKQLDGIESFGCVPYDKTLADALAEGKNISDIKTDSSAFTAVKKIIEDKLNFNS